MALKRLEAYLDDEELTPKFVATMVAITVAFLVIMGVLTYVVTFYVLGF